MKYMRYVLPFLLYGLLLNSVDAQTLNWGALENSKHVVTANVGLDYSVSYGIGYGYKIGVKNPIVFSGDFSMPLGNQLLDDFKTKIGAQFLLVKKSNFSGVLSLQGIYRRYQNDLVRFQNFGSLLKFTFGYYKPKWFLGTELAFDKAVITHFRHSQKYRDNIYTDVVDGWYGPSTGGNLNFGVQTGYSFKSSDFTINLGKVYSQDLKTSPLLPFFLNLGYNKRF